MADALTVVVNTTIVVLTGLTLFEWVRHRDWIRFEIFIPFAALTGLAVVGWLWPATVPTAGYMRASLAVIVGIPLVFLRLANRFRSVPRPLEWTAAGGYVLLMAFVLPTLPNPTPIGFAATLAFAVVVGVYAAISFMLGALRTAGVTRNRLALAAIGAWLLALVVLASSLGAAFEAVNESVDAAVQLGMLGMALALYFAFAPPVPVRRWWNAVELQRFLDDEPPDDASDAWRPLERLAGAARRTTGSRDAKVLLARDTVAGIGGADEAPEHVVIVDGPPSGLEATGWVHGDDASDRLKQFQTSDDIESFFVVPLRARRSWGALVVCLPHTPLFPDEDLQLLSHFAHQAARELEDAASLAALAQSVDELEELNRFKTDFINATAHELANPLVPVRIQLKLLEAAVDGSEKHGKSLAIVRRSIDRLGLIIENMLTAARLQNARLQIPKERVDLQQVMMESVENYQDVAESKGITLDVVVVAGDADVVGGRLQLSQVVSNLLSNACKYTPAGGHVMVRMTRTRDRATVEVVDTGIGMTPEKQDQLFQPFRRVHSKDESDAPGTGLGLYISRQLIDLQGGQMWCRSGGPGHGSTFAFSVPLAADTAAATPLRRGRSDEVQGAGFEPANH